MEPTTRELLDRIDTSIAEERAARERNDAHFAELFRRMDERLALDTKRFEERRQADEARRREHEAQMREHETNRQEHERMLERFARSEDRVIEAMSEINLEIHANTEHLNDMRGAIQANTRAVLAALDRFEGRNGDA